MKRRIILMSLLALAAVVRAQDEMRYKTMVKEAWTLYEQKEYGASAARYSAAFQALNWKAYRDDRYNAACSWAMAGGTDSAFFNLQRIAEKMDYADVRHITTDPDLTSLHMDARWLPLIALVQANKEKQEANLDRPLVALLDSILTKDQSLRDQIDEVEAKYGRDSKEMRSHWKRMHETDSMNIIVVTKILDERGWLGADVVGSAGNSALFLVIQHADLSTQEKYLPMMRAAVSGGKANASSLALLEDRILMRNGKLQLYGSQIGRDPATGEYYLSPLEDPDNVDVRRARMGLDPLADYLLNWNMKWDVEAYKAQLPELVRKYKVINR